MTTETDDDDALDEDDGWLAGDPVLTFLIATTELAAVQIEVTLLVNGMVVSGRLIDELTYIGRLADLLWQTDGAQSEQEPVDRDRPGKLRDQIHALLPDAPIGSDYVHLEHVTIARGAGDVSHVPLWRGRAATIGGWGISERQ